MQILILEGTQVNYGDDRGGVHEDGGAICNVPKDVATKLTTSARALYVNRTDDPFKDGRFTAAADMVKAAEAMAKAKAKAAKTTAAPPATPPAEPGSDQTPAA